MKPIKSLANQLFVKVATQTPEERFADVPTDRLRMYLEGLKRRSESARHQALGNSAFSSRPRMAFDLIANLYDPSSKMISEFDKAEAERDGYDDTAAAVRKVLDQRELQDTHNRLNLEAYNSLEPSSQATFEELYRKANPSSTLQFPKPPQVTQPEAQPETPAQGATQPAVQPVAAAVPQATQQQTSTAPTAPVSTPAPAAPSPLMSVSSSPTLEMPELPPIPQPAPPQPAPHQPAAPAAQTAPQAPQMAQPKTPFSKPTAPTPPPQPKQKVIADEHGEYEQDQNGNFNLVRPATPEPPQPALPANYAALSTPPAGTQPHKYEHKPAQYKIPVRGAGV